MPKNGKYTKRPQNVKKYAKPPQNIPNVNEIYEIFPLQGLQKYGTMALCQPTECQPIECQPTECQPTECQPTECQPTECQPTECHFYNIRPNVTRPNVTQPNVTHLRQNVTYGGMSLPNVAFYNIKPLIKNRTFYT
jgi:hypothetical protein